MDTGNAVFAGVTPSGDGDVQRLGAGGIDLRELPDQRVTLLRSFPNDLALSGEATAAEGKYLGINN